MIIGGPNRYYAYSTKNIEKIFTKLKNLVEKNNLQLIVIPSMRTPKNIINYAKEFFGENHTFVEGG